MRSKTPRRCTASAEGRPKTRGRADFESARGFRPEARRGSSPTRVETRPPSLSGAVTGFPSRQTGKLKTRYASLRIPMLELRRHLRAVAAHAGCRRGSGLPEVPVGRSRATAFQHRQPHVIQRRAARSVRCAGFLVRFRALPLRGLVAQGIRAADGGAGRAGTGAAAGVHQFGGHEVRPDRSGVVQSRPRRDTE